MSAAPESPAPAPSPLDRAPATLAQRFAEAWVNRVHRVCGLRLDPHCLHHILMLHAIGNPLGAAAVGSDEKIGWGDLLQAVLICRSPYEQEIFFPRRPLLWHLRVWWLGLWHRLRRRPGTALAWHCAAFRSYQNDYESQPDLFITDQGEPLTAPGLLAKGVFLQMHLHLDDRRVWTMPIGKALFSYAACIEQVSSSARLLESDESELMDILRQIQRGEIPIPENLRPPVEADRPALTPELFGSED